jgi:hypothetical protein
MTSGIYNHKKGIRKCSKETKVKIGDKNSKKMKEYWKNNEPTEKQLEFRNKRKEEIKNERCYKCGAIISKNKIHNCKEVKEKQKIGHIGLKHSKKHNETISESNKGKHNRIKSLNERIKISASNQGIELKDWCGFRNKEEKRLRRTSMWKIWRNAIFLRDKFICQNNNCPYCNNKSGIYLHPHHIKPLKLFPELAFDVNNGITYCKDYHIKSNLHKNIRGKNR